MRAALERLCCRVKHKFGPWEESHDGYWYTFCERKSCDVFTRITKPEYEMGRRTARFYDERRLRMCIAERKICGGKTIVFHRYAELFPSTEPMESLTIGKEAEKTEDKESARAYNQRLSGELPILNGAELKALVGKEAEKNERKPENSLDG